MAYSRRAQTANHYLHARQRSLLTSTKRRLINPAWRHNSLAREAWVALSSIREALLLTQLEDPSLPDIALDTDHPWWCAILSTDPAFLKLADRASCELIMGLAAKGSPPPDWSAIFTSCVKLFADGSRRAGCSGSELHLCHGSAQNPPVFMDGRAAILMPGYHDNDFFKFLSIDAHLFDFRRAKRRFHRDVPDSWCALAGDHAQALWERGLSENALFSKPFEHWAESVGAMVRAMKINGALRAMRVPGFFMQFPDSMDNDFQAMTHIDQERRDPLRSRWDIESSVCLALTSKPRFGL